MWLTPGSGRSPVGRAEALRRLDDKGTYQIGRYGLWRFQRIADSIRDGFVAGSSFRMFPAGTGPGSASHVSGGKHERIA
jgi:transposase